MNIALSRGHRNYASERSYILYNIDNRGESPSLKKDIRYPARP